MSLKGVVDDVHVLDSGSQDATIDLAQSAGAKTYVHPFTGFGTQRNWAIDSIPCRYDWTFHLDADEKFTPELVDELSMILSQPIEKAGYYVSNRLFLGDRWLRYSSGFPVYQVRLFHRQRLRFEDYGHGQREVTDGSLGYLKASYDHYGFSKGIDDWFRKHAIYARREAETLLRDRRDITQLAIDLLMGGAVARRRALKQLAMRIPFRPYARMFHTLILKRGIFDGRAGWTYARMLATYEFMIDAHVSRLRAKLEI